MIYKVGLIGTKEVEIVEAESPELACFVAGWNPPACEVTDITRQIKILRDSGHIEGIHVLRTRRRSKPNLI